MTISNLLLALLAAIFTLKSPTMTITLSFSISSVAPNAIVPIIDSIDADGAA